MATNNWVLVPRSEYYKVTGADQLIKSAVGNNVVYVDSNMGLDSTGEGTPEKPYKTITKAVMSKDPSYEFICRGYFAEDLNAIPLDLVLISDYYGAATYDLSSIPSDWQLSKEFHNGWTFYFDKNTFKSNKYYSGGAKLTTFNGIFRDYVNKAFVETRIAPYKENDNQSLAYFMSAYNVDLRMIWTMFDLAYPGFTSQILSAENCEVHFVDPFMVDNNPYIMIFRDDCIFYNLSGSVISVTGSTDEEKTLSLRNQLGVPAYHNIYITSYNLYNDPENGNLTPTIYSEVMKRVSYSLNKEEVYASKDAPGYNIDILQSSAGIINAFDERSVEGSLYITSNNFIELKDRDSSGNPTSGGKIRTKVISYDRMYSLRGPNIVFDNGESGDGVKLGYRPFQTVKVRFVSVPGLEIGVDGLVNHATYLNLSGEIDIRDNNSVLRRIVVGESFEKGPNDTVLASSQNRFLSLFSDRNTGWMDVLPNEDIYIKRVGDQVNGNIDVDTEGNYLSNGNPNFYTDANRLRPSFRADARYVQYMIEVDYNKVTDYYLHLNPQIVNINIKGGSAVSVVDTNLPTWRIEE